MLPVPVHVPWVAVKVDPTTVEPLIVGSAVFVGPVGAAVTATVALEAAVAGPSEFEAVTRTRRREPTSPVAAM